MADEARIVSSLQIKVGKIDYRSSPTAFTADVSAQKGPSPGAITVSPSGTDVDLSQLDDPGLCRIMNIDDDNYVTFGIWDPEMSKFYPVGELLPGESFVLRLSRLLQEEVGTGTGTVGGASTNTLRFYAQASNSFVVVEAFER